MTSKVADVLLWQHRTPAIIRYKKIVSIIMSKYAVIAGYVICFGRFTVMVRYHKLLWLRY